MDESRLPTGARAGRTRAYNLGSFLNEWSRTQSPGSQSTASPSPFPAASQTESLRRRAHNPNDLAAAGRLINAVVDVHDGHGKQHLLEVVW